MTATDVPVNDFMGYIIVQFTGEKIIFKIWDLESAKIVVMKVNKI